MESTGERALLKLLGELDLASAPSLEEELERLGDAARIIVDLRELEFIDSTGLSLLVKANQRSEEGGGEFAVVTARDGQVRRLLDMTGLQDRLRVAETVEGLTGS